MDERTICQRYTIAKRGFDPYTYIMAKLPMDHVAMDLFEFPRSTVGYCLVLVVVDICTRFTFLRALTHKDMAWVAKMLYKLFLELGFPRIIQSDNGTEFANEVIYAIVELMKIDMRHTTPYNRRANGAAERFVRTSKSTLLKAIAADTS